MMPRGSRVAAQPSMDLRVVRFRFGMTRVKLIACRGGPGLFLGEHFGAALAQGGQREQQQ